jgi:hypothetical protein
MADIFISHAGKNVRMVKNLASDLEKKGISTWWYESDMPSGVKIREKIEKAIEESLLVVVLWSKDSINNDWVCGEAEQAKNMGKLFSVCIGVSKPPLGYQEIYCLQFEKSNRITGDPAYKKFIRELRKELSNKITFKIKRLIAPGSLDNKSKYVVASNPLTFRAAYGGKGGWMDKDIVTYSDYVGVRGLMQAFGSIYGLERLPELINPDDFDNEVINNKMNLFSIGSPKVNRWTSTLMENFFNPRRSNWYFSLDPDWKDIQHPHAVIRNEHGIYEPRKPGNKNRLYWDFGIVLRGARKSSSNMFMVLAGRSALGTEASCLAVTHPECVSHMIEALEKNDIDIDNHRKAFCATVSIRAEQTKEAKHAKEAKGNTESLKLKTRLDSFRVEDVFAL